jgi:hypothetical protein
MTRPEERTRTLVQAREFLEELASDVSEANGIRTEARRLLRHYPTAEELLLHGRILEERRFELIVEPFITSRME